MNEKKIKRISKFLSLLLRHQPEKIGLQLDSNGWAVVEELLQKSRKHGVRFSIDELEGLVVNNDKKRFTFNDDKTKIRANQGHSLKTIDIELKPVQPPEFLYHGTVAKFMNVIHDKGLQKMSRQHVHLSAEIETAMKVGSRRGKPIILTVKSGEMQSEGYEFYLSENNVWLTDSVPSEFIVLKS
ncbi:putative RNA 2'-phosphotransferase [Tenacibaculum sp. MAR_2010_89]|uniref:RNA 2'-phosphotransferase n=1 Tax=Tenacibaculum sp. MAR_2010_89 TaxID=1250198 RepID=UPI00089743B0|nr:RNA 2'-phosphotransferase [Tenacibaculum sp. MAR_2010_89]SEE32399.1 putative RNA 2'-phosphotransferase [Tenacibaculum sp. MAR_2010_89]